MTGHVSACGRGRPKQHGSGAPWFGCTMVRVHRGSGAPWFGCTVEPGSREGGGSLLAKDGVKCFDRVLWVPNLSLVGRESNVLLRSSKQQQAHTIKTEPVPELKQQCRLRRIAGSTVAKKLSKASINKGGEVSKTKNMCKVDVGWCVR
jgi:hypothetical protein